MATHGTSPSRMMNGAQSDPDVRKSAEEMNGKANGHAHGHTNGNGHAALDLAETVSGHEICHGNRARI
jgi:hypothetical protein